MAEANFEEKKAAQEYFLVIGGGVLQIPVIEEVKSMGLLAIVSDANSDCICAALSDIFWPIDIFDIDRHLTEIDSFHSKEKIVGVLAAGIDAPETMAAVAAHLGLPGVGQDVARLVNHKDQFREKMVELGLATPDFKIIDANNVDRLGEWISKIGYPLIVKNTSSSGSRATKIFWSHDDAGVKQMVLAAMKVSRSNKALIESVWDGSEHTAETIFDVDGKFHRCFITDRIFDKSEGFALETGLVHPTCLSPEQQDQIYELAESVSRKLGITIGAAKFDIIQTAEGPRIIEMTVRLSGGYDCQYLVPAATGKNVIRAAIDTALGQKLDPGVLLDRKNRVAVSQSLWPKPGVITAIDGVEEAKSMCGFEQIFFRYQLGDEVEEYIDCTKRVCFIIASGSDEDDADRNIEAIKKRITITTSPSGAGGRVEGNL